MICQYANIRAETVILYVDDTTLPTFRDVEMTNASGITAVRDAAS